MADDTPGDRLRAARKKLFPRSASAAAKRFGWPISTYLSHENGQTAEIPIKAARKYAKAFKVSASWLNHGDVEANPVIAKSVIERLLKSLPPESHPEAVQYLEYLVATRRKK